MMIKAFPGDIAGLIFGNQTDFCTRTLKVAQGKKTGVNVFIFNKAWMAWKEIITHLNTGFYIFFKDFIQNKARAASFDIVLFG